MEFNNGLYILVITVMKGAQMQIMNVCCVNVKKNKFIFNALAKQAEMEKLIIFFFCFLQKWIVIEVIALLVTSIIKI